jgi:hypothetical protein
MGLSRVIAVAMPQVISIFYQTFLYIIQYSNCDYTEALYHTVSIFVLLCQRKSFVHKLVVSSAETFCDKRLFTFRLLNAVQAGRFLLHQTTRRVYQTCLILFYVA